MELLVQPGNLRLSFQSGRNMLEVLRENAVPVSYSCMSGRCGTCRCKLIQGHISHSGPLGTAYLRQKHTGPMLCVGGGTGIAPIVSIVRGAIAEGIRAGLVTDAIQADLPQLQHFAGYFCGAPAMVEALNKLAHSMGMPIEKIQVDAFYPSGI